MLEVKKAMNKNVVGRMIKKSSELNCFKIDIGYSKYQPMAVAEIIMRL